MQNIARALLSLTVLASGISATRHACAVEDSKAAAPAPKFNYRTSQREGWTLQIREELFAKDEPMLKKALELLDGQLKEINRVVPKPALAELHKVPLWFSPEYPGVRPTAEFHPDADWLRENGRDPAMAKGVEFTDIKDFEREFKRMPMVVLHELSHGYHNRALPRGFENPEIIAAYDKAKASGVYDKVEQRFGDGRSKKVRAYAMTNPMEYFAESSEAFFGTNDFFPFNNDELAKNDPTMHALLTKLWGVDDAKK